MLTDMKERQQNVNKIVPCEYRFCSAKYMEH